MDGTHHGSWLPELTSESSVHHVSMVHLAKTSRSFCEDLSEPMTRIELAYLAWEASALPLSYIGVDA